MAGPFRLPRCTPSEKSGRDAPRWGATDAVAGPYRLPRGAPLERGWLGRPPVGCDRHRGRRAAAAMHTILKWSYHIDIYCTTGNGGCVVGTPPVGRYRRPPPPGGGGDGALDPRANLTHGHLLHDGEWRIKRAPSVGHTMVGAMGCSGTCRCIRLRTRMRANGFPSLSSRHIVSARCALAGLRVRARGPLGRACATLPWRAGCADEIEAQERLGDEGAPECAPCPQPTAKAEMHSYHG